MKFQWLLWTLIVLAYGCSPKKMVQETVFTDCLAERKNTGQLDNQQGVISKISDVFVIVQINGNERFLPCNLPETCKKDGQKVSYSLVVKEILPTERRIATPCYLKYIEVKDN